jgi:hypothetical protein
MDSGGEQDHYILDEHDQPVPVDLLTWGRWSADFDNRRVASWVAVNPRRPDCPIHVSTVFLGINHNWDPAGPPLLFETMIFAAGYEIDKTTARAATMTEARVKHDVGVALVTHVLAAEREEALRNQRAPG